MTSSPCFNLLNSKTHNGLVVSVFIILMTMFSLSSHAYAPSPIYEETFDNELSSYTTTGNVSIEVGENGQPEITLRGGADSSITLDVDLTGYTLSTIETFASSLYGLDYGEALVFSYSFNGTPFIELERVNELNLSLPIILLPRLADNRQISLRISLDASSYFEKATINTVRAFSLYPYTPSLDSPLPSVSSVAEPGPFDVTTISQTGPNGNSFIAAPATLGENNLKHPIFVWAPGTGRTPEEDVALLEHIASHGFVVISQYSSGTGIEMDKAMEWLRTEHQTDTSMFYKKLNLGKSAAGGHSRGARGIFNAYHTFMTTIHVAGASNFYSEGPEAITWGNALYIAASEDSYTSAKMLSDYQETYRPSFFSSIDNANQYNINDISLPMITAWLRWQIGGDTDRRDEFLSTNCEYCQSPYASQSQYWD